VFALGAAPFARADPHPPPGSCPAPLLVVQEALEKALQVVVTGRVEIPYQIG